MKNYVKGLRHGLPIALGYLSVAFAFGIQATMEGPYPIQAVLISFFNVTSAGQSWRALASPWPPEEA